MAPNGSPFPIERSNYYQFWLRERAEINRHKWVLSEQVGHDIGFSYAQWDWINRHRSSWLKALQASGEKTY